jgi:hypothetical protein
LRHVWNNWTVRKVWSIESRVIYIGNKDAGTLELRGAARERKLLKPEVAPIHEHLLAVMFGHTVVFPQEGQMRFLGQASRSNKFAILCAADKRNKVFLDLEGYLRKLA